MAERDQLGDPGLFWARIVVSASCPRSFSSQCPRPPRGARFRAAFPAARLSSPVAGRSGNAARDGDGPGARGRPAHIVAKMNALLEPSIIQALYQPRKPARKST